MKNFILATLFALLPASLSAGTVTFSAPNSASSDAVFSSTGTYTLKVTVTDGFLTSIAITTVTVLNPVIAPKLTVLPTSVIGGNSVDVLVSLSTGTTGVSSLQFDMILPSGVIYQSVSDGAASVAAGKTATGAVITGGARVLVFGINQNSIGTGSVALVRLGVAVQTPTGSKTLTLSNLGASDPAGNNVVITGTNGVIAVTVNKAPIVTVSASQTITFPTNSVIVTATATDDGAPNPPGTLAYQWSVQ